MTRHDENHIPEDPIIYSEAGKLIHSMVTLTKHLFLPLPYSSSFLKSCWGYCASSFDTHLRESFSQKSLHSFQPNSISLLSEQLLEQHLTVEFNSMCLCSGWTIVWVQELSLALMCSVRAVKLGSFHPWGNSKSDGAQSWAICSSWPLGQQ